MSTTKIWQALMILGILTAFLFSGCQSSSVETSPVETQVTATASEQEDTDAPTPLQPTETPVSLAAQVNGDAITIAEYQAELARYRAAIGTELATEYEELVMQELIDQFLMSQAAADAGFVVDDAMLQSRIDQLDIGVEALGSWLNEHGYTDETFRSALGRSIAAAWMRDRIVAEVSQTAEQVHARQILLYNSDEADTVFNQLESGADFETLAEQYDPLHGGDLGWFPRGYLTVPELDDVIFSLSPGDYSPVTQTMLGFHIVQLIEKDTAYLLNPNAYRVVQTQTLEQWLQDRRTQSEISIYSP
ncbi:MAG: peptidylprolyl isomerase [Anaerolineales bacterium]|nr:peptidylprolyl isomerase [Chloroflexota bacterium]MBL6982148.1 peptidylprolyl isomerase [Anaerolineales bacterium]